LEKDGKAPALPAKEDPSSEKKASRKPFPGDQGVCAVWPQAANGNLLNIKIEAKKKYCYAREKGDWRNVVQ